MEFTFETEYNVRHLTEMARVVRKTVRKKHSRRSHIFGWCCAALGALCVLLAGWPPDFRSVVTLAAVVVLVAVLLFEDKLNGYVASKRLLPGTEKAVTVFTEQGFYSTTEAGKTEWNYDKIQVIAETKDFFVFLYSQNHAQLYDKHHLQGGTPDDFRRFITEVTGKPVCAV